MRYLNRFSLPVGLVIWMVYQVVNRLVTIPDAIAIPMMIVSIFLMMIGVFCQGRCFGKRKNPYDFKDQRKEDE